MGRSQKFDEYAFLNLFYQKMLEEGQRHNLIDLSVDNRMVEDIREKFGISLTEESVRALADICSANNWIQHIYMGAGNYEHLQLTTTGFGVVRSKRMQAEASKKRSTMKKSSDFIEDHKGLFTILGAIIGIIGVLIAIYGI